MKYSIQNMTDRELFKRKLESEKHDSQDAFEQDALEGWRNSGAKIDLLAPLDKKYRKNNSNIWIPITSLLILGLVIFYFLPNQKTKKQAEKQIASRKSITIEKSDVFIPEKIDELIPVEKKKSVQIKTLKANFEAKKIEENKQDNQSVIAESSKIEPKKINEIPSKENIKLKTNKSKAIEIYLHDLLTIDYRKYRSKPVIKSESAII
ncbi:MAG: hypothetical protein ACK5B9_04595, partial [Flavobacteriia bacterium]